jgi:hypothetical protein
MPSEQDDEDVDDVKDDAVGAEESSAESSSTPPSLSCAPPSSAGFEAHDGSVDPIAVVSVRTVSRIHKPTAGTLVKTSTDPEPLEATPMTSVRSSLTAPPPESPGSV